MEQTPPAEAEEPGDADQADADQADADQAGAEEASGAGQPPGGAREQRGASDKQLKFIEVLQAKVGLDAAELARIVAQVAETSTLAELTRGEASELIDELHVQARERGVNLDAQERLSDKQLSFIRSLKRRAHLTDEEFAGLLREHTGVSEVEEAGRRDASGLIEALLERSKGGGRAPAKAPSPPGPTPPPPLTEEEDYDDDVPF